MCHTAGNMKAASVQRRSVAQETLDLHYHSGLCWVSVNTDLHTAFLIPQPCLLSDFPQSIELHSLPTLKMFLNETMHS